MVKVVKIGEEEAQIEEIDIETNVEDDDSRIARERLRVGIIAELQEDKQALRSSVLDEIHEDYKEKQKFVKKVYYALIGVLYFTLCSLFNYYVMYVDYYERQISFEFLSLFWFLLDTFLIALIFPFVILALSFASGGLLLGVFVGLTYGLLSLIARGIMKVLGFNLELIFPELVGHTGVVSKPNVLGKFTHYNLSVEIEKAGLYGNSFWHGNNIAARSKGDEIPVGTKVRVIQASYWSLSSLLRNSPVITVVPEE